MQKMMLDILEKVSIIVLLFEINLNVMYALVSYF